MPEHVHLLMSEPERSSLAVALQMLKQISSPRLAGDGRFWQKRYYDFNVWTERKRIEKLRYMDRNPAKRRLVENPEEWKWSSYRHYLTGVEGAVEVESEWTARKREGMGTVPSLKRRARVSVPHSSPTSGERVGQPPMGNLGMPLEKL